MQTEYTHRKFCRIDAIRDELSPPAAERFDSLALFDQLRLEGASRASAPWPTGAAELELVRRARLRAQRVRHRAHDRPPGARRAQAAAQVRPPR